MPGNDLNLSDSDEPGKLNLTDAAGDGFVTSVRGLFNNQRLKAKEFVLQTMRAEEDNEFPGPEDSSESDTESSALAEQLTISNAKKLIRRHTRKFHRAQKASGDLS